MEIIKERFELALERIKSIDEEKFELEAYDRYFKYCAQFLCKMEETYQWVLNKEYVGAKVEAIAQKNKELYEDILNDNYESSYGNPSFAQKEFGEEFGKILCFLYAELRSLIGAAYELDLEMMTIYFELFIEIYNVFEYEWSEMQTLPKVETLREILYWFASDYAEIATEKRVGAQVDPKLSYATDIVMDSDLEDMRYLYQYGEYITENEIRTAKHMNSLSEEKIKLLAGTYTEGYRIGFVTTGKDLSKKGAVGIYYKIGFERMIRQAILNFREMGLEPVIFRPTLNILQNRSVVKNGFVGAIPNKQYDYDHKDDVALILDRPYINRKLEVTRGAYELHKEAAGLYAGPAVLEVFGETPFTPQSKKEAIHLSKEQQKLSVEHRSGAMDIQRQYIKEEERSFTIIAFPTPDIGEQFEEIFDEIVRINTLDYELYQGIQQKIINVLDEASFVEIKGMNGNRTDLKVMMYEMTDPATQTIFENCVADVNIPVGEVFTSPKLTGTDGILHVSRVFLNELEYKDLQITFKDGKIADYSCGNFETEEENKKFIKENLMYHQDTLPLGEFAIGTNTVAYVAAKKFDIAAKLPILIAEKMGPHFAVGDTCYSHTEDIAVFNPDDKEIVARDNECSLLRKTEPQNAYFNCHTDITIPYDELAELAAVRKDGSKEVIIRAGRFVLAGCEELNKAFDN